MAVVLVGLGSNLGDRPGNLAAAVQRLAGEMRLVATSRFHATKPAGGPAGQDEFLNAVARFESDLSPIAILDWLQRTENELGRRREVRWGPRTIDLDLLLVDDVVLETPRLTLPHPRLSFRRFVLAPAVEVAAEVVHPTIGWTLGQLLEHLDSAADRVVITGPDDAANERLRRAVQSVSNWKFEISGPGESRLESRRLLVVLGDPTRDVTGVGPVLRLDPVDFDAAVEEVRAALQALE